MSLGGTPTLLITRVFWGRGPVGMADLRVKEITL